MNSVTKLDDLEIMFLEHYGVKGMKWGVRRSQEQLDRAAGRKTKRPEKKALNRRNSNYGSKQRSLDRQMYGRGGEKRINKRMNKGRSLKSARRIEMGRSFVKSLVASTAGAAISIEMLTGGAMSRAAISAGGKKLQAAAEAQARRNAGRNAANQLLSDFSSYRLPYTKKRRGRYKIHTM